MQEYFSGCSAGGFWMNRKEFNMTIGLGAAALLLNPHSSAEAPEASDKNPEVFSLRGVYFHDGFEVDPIHHAPLHWGRDEWMREIRWLKACGINAIEFATMLEFNRIPKTDMEKKKISDRLEVMELAHSLGMKFGYILSNTVVSTVPDNEEPGNQMKNRAVQLCPQKKENFEQTVALQEWYMNTYRKADFYEEFAADWGGCHCGQCTVDDYMKYVDTFARDAQAMNPEARLYANTWCIAYWGPSPEEQGWKKVFENEIAGSRKVIELLPAMPPNTHLTLPCHHLYRPLVYQQCGGKSKTPVFPTHEDIQSVTQSGRDVMAWPHFIMDDDTGRSMQWGIVHSEVRYIRELLQRLQLTGIRQIMGNLYLPWLQILNTYAYGRLLQEPSLPAEQIIHEFAGLIASPGDVNQLTEVLFWMENHSYWQEQMPEDARLPSIPCSMDKAAAASAVEKLKPNSSPALPLPYSPAEWLQDLSRSIGRMTWVV